MMSDWLIIGSFLISPFLWIASIMLTKDWRHFKKLIVINCAIIVCYLIVLNLTGRINIGHDEYGLRKLALNISCFVLHIILGFIASIIINGKMKKDYR